MRTPVTRALAFAVLTLLACGVEASPPKPNAAAAAAGIPNCAVPPDLGEILKRSFGGYDGMVRVTHPRYFTALYCGIGAELSRSDDVRRGWDELDFAEWSEGRRFDDAIVRFAAARATFSLCVALQHGHVMATPAKLNTLSAITAVGDRRALPFVYGYALRVADALAVDPDLRVALLAALANISGKSADPRSAYDPDLFRAAVETYATELP